MMLGVDSKPLGILSSLRTQTGPWSDTASYYNIAYSFLSQALSTEYQGGPQTFPEFATLNGTVIELGKLNNCAIVDSKFLILRSTRRFPRGSTPLYRAQPNPSHPQLQCWIHVRPNSPYRHCYRHRHCVCHPHRHPQSHLKHKKYHFEWSLPGLFSCSSSRSSSESCMQTMTGTRLARCVVTSNCQKPLWTPHLTNRWVGTEAPLPRSSFPSRY